MIKHKPIVALIATSALTFGLCVGFTYGQWNNLVVETQSVASIISSKESEEILPPDLEETDIVALTKPAVVRIFTEIDGEIVVPNFEADFDNFSIKILPGEKERIDIVESIGEKYMTGGTGFFIDSSGLIVTNAHVVSAQALKESAAQNVLTSDYYESLYEALYETMYGSSISSLGDDETAVELEQKEIEKRFKMMLEALVSEVKLYGTRTVTVVQPNAVEGNLKKQLESGLVAEVKYVNNEYAQDSKDIAVLEVEGDSFPSLQMSEVESLKIGQSVYAFGYPGTADLESIANEENLKDLSKATFSSGLVNSFKEAPDSDFAMIQTDAKVSLGSSGSPLLDKNGKVIGIVSSLTNGASGDGFAFAVPVSLIQNVLISENISSEGLNSEYYKNMTDGISLLRNNQCKLAKEKFMDADIGNDNFTTVTYVHPYVEECDALIASGKSIDSRWDAFKLEFLSSNYLMVAVGISVAFFITMLFLIIVLFIRNSQQKFVQNNPQPLPG